MTPYYSDATFTLYRGDALEVLPGLPDRSAQAVITDPPYALPSTSALHKTDGWADLMNTAYWLSAWYREADRIRRDDGAFWTFCSWRGIPAVLRAAATARMGVSAITVWDKEIIGVGGPRGLRSSYELCVLLPGTRFRVVDRRIRDVWRLRTPTHKPTGHPAEKPEAIIERIITVSGLRPGDTVLDPFIGSGTTAIAAARHGLRCVGVEADTQWCDFAVSRLLDYRTARRTS